MKKLILVPLLMFLTSCGSLKDNCKLGGQTCRTLFGASDFENDTNLEELEARVKANENDIKSLQSLVNALLSSVLNIETNILQNESLIATLNSQVTLLNNSQTSQDVLITALQNSNLNLVNQLSTLEGSQGTQDASIASLQAAITANNAQIAALQSGQVTQDTAITNLETFVANLDAVNNNQNILLATQQTQINDSLVSIANLEGYSNITSIKDPCGDKANVYDEVFLVLSTGEILTSFSDQANGKNTRFAKLVPGSFITTDNSNCYFTVVADPVPGKPNQVKLTNEHY